MSDEPRGVSDPIQGLGRRRIAALLAFGIVAALWSWLAAKCETVARGLAVREQQLDEFDRLQAGGVRDPDAAARRLHELGELFGDARLGWQRVRSDGHVAIFGIEAAAGATTTRVAAR